MGFFNGFFGVTFIFLIFAIAFNFAKTKKLKKGNGKQMIRQLDIGFVLGVVNGDQQKEYIIIDVRSAKEFNRYRIPGAKSIDVMDFSFNRKIKKLDKRKKYILYGQRDSRSQRAFDIMKKRGFREVYIMDGGFLAWNIADYIVVK